MVAVTTDIHTRRGTAGRRRHLTPVPDRTRQAALPSRPVGEGREAAATYRVRRAVAAVVVVALGLTAWAALGAVGGLLFGSGAATAAPGAAPAEVVVAPGDTLWSIASRLQGEGDVRPLVDRLVTAHGGSTLQVGERISVPRG